MTDQEILDKFNQYKPETQKKLLWVFRNRHNGIRATARKGKTIFEPDWNDFKTYKDEMFVSFLKAYIKCRSVNNIKTKLLDTSKGYVRGNVEFGKEQGSSLSGRKPITFTFEGKEYSVREFSLHFGVPQGILYSLHSKNQLNSTNLKKSILSLQKPVNLNTQLYDMDGKLWTVSDLVAEAKRRRTNVRRTTIYERLRRGFTPHEAISIRKEQTIKKFWLKPKIKNKHVIFKYRTTKIRRSNTSATDDKPE